MSSHGFRSVYMAASIAGTALACYLVSLNVASERAKLETVEEKIVLAQRDIRVLQTEIGTRGRLAQLERWNARFIRLSAPSADQFLEGGFQLAAMTRPEHKPAIQAPVILAAAPAEALQRPSATSDSADAQPVVAGAPAKPAELLHQASYSRPERPASAPTPVADKKPAKAPVAVNPVTAKPAKAAMADPLAPLPAATRPAKGGAAKPATGKSKESAPAR